jgi:hypothetical protein
MVPPSTRTKTAPVAANCRTEGLFRAIQDLPLQIRRGLSAVQSGLVAYFSRIRIFAILRSPSDTPSRGVSRYWSMVQNGYGLASADVARSGRRCDLVQVSGRNRSGRSSSEMPNVSEAPLCPPLNVTQTEVSKADTAPECESLSVEDTIS